MELGEGKTLGRYQLRAVLGEGGMGVVYRAFDPNLQREVAIKVMHPHLQRKPGFKERFLQEGVVAARLKHPGIVQVYDSGEAGVLFMVMAYIHGSSLEEMLQELRQQGQWVVLPEAVELAQQVAEALDYAHKHGVLHRDIKPSNIMLEAEPSGGLPYRPVLTDLGLAKLLEGGIETETGTSMGTPAYMSPEQAQGRAVDTRSDVYSLGALLYHLCAGKPPFPAKTITEAIRYHVFEPPPPPRQVNPRITPELEAAILKTLEKDPARRFPDCAQFAAALGQIRPGLAAAAGLASTAVDAGDGVSLATVLEKSLVKPRGQSVLDEFPAAAPAAIDVLQVLEPGKPARALPVNTQVIDVGRTADNQVALDDPKVSRHHVRIEHSGGGYRVIDQGSSNGTFLAGVRLLKGVAQDWAPDQPLQVGDTYLKLERSREAAATQADTAKLTARADAQAAGRFSVTLDKPQLAVEAGSAAALEVRIRNQGSQVDHYTLSVEGAPPAWVKNLPAAPLRCMPSEEQTVSLLIQPPRSPQSRAGRYPLGIVVTCDEDRTAIARSASTLTLAPFRQFTGQLDPERVKAGRPGRVRLSNLGNQPEMLQVTFSDPADELEFHPPQANVKVDGGQTAQVEFRAQPRQARLMGAEKVQRFNAVIGAAEAPPQTLSGEVASRGRVPACLLPLLLALCVLALAGVGGYYTFVVVPAQNAARTALALAGQGATATFDLSDPDGDGLSNAREAKYDTAPNNPDSDGDGLKDGEEVDVYHTDPKNRDSDGDTLLDGVEVNAQKTNPNNPDTDGDGLQDNVDPDPGRLPTPTFTATIGYAATTQAAQTGTAFAANQNAATQTAARAATNAAASQTAAEQTRLTATAFAASQTAAALAANQTGTALAASQTAAEAQKRTAEAFAIANRTEIDKKYRDLGGESSFLGPPSGPERSLGGPNTYREFQNGVIYYSPTTGAHELHGQILALWLDLGATGFLGFPKTDETSTPDGVGRYNHFPGGSIYWTPDTGAHEIYGSIRELWASMGWEKSILGYPTTGETSTPDGEGRFNHFQGGSIYWTPDTGAHEIYGSIRELWAGLGWERSFLGYPTTGENGCPDGVGRYNHFQGGSIYWTPDTGAHEVHGSILALWSSLGWERSWLGYPISDEEPSSDGWERQSRFQHGVIKWSGANGAQAFGY